MFINKEYLSRIKELRREELTVCDKAETFLQSSFWGAFKARFGWEALAFSVIWRTSTNDEEKPLLVLRRKLAPGFALAYIPWGPLLPLEFQNHDANEAIKELSFFLARTLSKDTVFIRFDLPWHENVSVIKPPFIRSPVNVQAPDTVVIDLTQPLESLKKQMKPKWRYNAGLALKKGVVVRRYGVEGIGIFYELLKETASRDGIFIHSIEYYSSLFEESQINEISSSHLPMQISLYLAEHEGDILAGIITFFRGREAVYLYGASSDKKRSFMAPYALQIKAMEDAKAFGSSEYDLFGIPPNEDPSHPMAGLYRFKTGFGGKIIHRPGSWDYPCRPFIYSLFRKAETLRKNLRTIKKKIVRR